MCFFESTIDDIIELFPVFFTISKLAKQNLLFPTNANPKYSPLPFLTNSKEERRRFLKELNSSVTFFLSTKQGIFEILEPNKLIL